jgi:hypothetical protein
MIKISFFTWKHCYQLIPKGILAAHAGGAAGERDLQYGSTSLAVLKGV